MIFKRGTGPLVSVLIPTRSRTQSLCESVDSLHSLAKNPGAIEYCFKVDEDDTGSIDTVRKLSRLVPSRILISSRGRGYLELNNFMNDLSAIAKGDWLFGFNDDARMLTSHWDEMLENINPYDIPKFGGNSDVCMFIPKVIQREVSAEFHIIRRKTFQIMGHLSRTYATDVYLYYVMSGVNAAIVLEDMKVSHNINDIDDFTKREGKLTADKELMPFLDTEECQALYDEDIIKLKNYIEGCKSVLSNYTK